jgi:GR25 family glycosyltransferase involved in LPS biosynthesis
MISVLVLNLQRDAARRAWMREHLSALHIPYRFVPGIDGRTIPDDAALPVMDLFRRSYGREMTRGELGCARAHLELIRQIASGDDPLVCVLEDDIELTHATRAFLHELVLSRIPPFDVLRFYSHHHRQRHAAWHQATVLGRAVVAPFRAGWGTYAQVYTREGARKLADRPIVAPIDGMLYYDCPLPGLRILEIRPSLVHMRGMGSNTEGWSNAGNYIKRKVKYPLMARAHFLRTWGMPGVLGLMRSRYRPSPGAPDLLNDMLWTTPCPTCQRTDGMHPAASFATVRSSRQGATSAIGDLSAT